MTLNEAINKVPALSATAPASRCSMRYAFVPTLAVIEPLLARGWQIHSVHQNQKSDPHALHRVDMVLPGGDGKKLVGELFPTVTLINSHNGTRSLWWEAGINVCVCSNQLIVPTTETSTLKLRHFGRASEIVDRLLGLGAQPDGIVGQVQRMQDIYLQPQEQLTFARQALAHTHERPSIDWVQPSEAAPLLEPLRESQRGINNVWTTLNVVQENLIERGRKGRGIHEIMRNTRLNKLLWTDAAAFLN